MAPTFSEVTFGSSSVVGSVLASWLQGPVSLWGEGHQHKAAPIAQPGVMQGVEEETGGMQGGAGTQDSWVLCQCWEGSGVWWFRAGRLSQDSCSHHPFPLAQFPLWDVGRRKIPGNLQGLGVPSMGVVVLLHTALLRLPCSCCAPSPLFAFTRLCSGVPFSSV